MISSEKRKFISGAWLLLLVAALLLLFFRAPFSYARAEDTKNITLQASVVASATPVRGNVYRRLSAGDTVTVTYALTQNDGLAESYFTPIYDRAAFSLTDFSVSNGWNLFDSYPYEDENGDLSYKTAAEHIAAYNAAAASGEDFPYDALIFEVFSTSLENLSLSDAFITVTYTALSDLVAPVVGSPVYYFGFSAAEAAADGNDLMEISFTSENGETLSMEKTAEIRVLAETSAVFPDQEVELRSGSLSRSDLDFEIVLPATDPSSGENAYLADGGEIEFLFYDGDIANGGSLLESEEGDPVFPSLPGEYYAVLRMPASEHFEGFETSAIVTVLKERVERPSVKARVSGETDPYSENGEGLIEFSYTYGHSLTFTAGDPESPFDFGAYTVSYFEKSEDEWISAPSNPFAASYLSVGSYRAEILPSDPERETFGGAEPIVIKVTVTPAVLTITGKVAAESNEIYYGDYAPAYTYDATGAVADDEIEDLLLLVMPLPSCSYQWLDAPGVYDVDVIGNGDALDNYTVTFLKGELVVSKRPVTISASYSGAVVTFSAVGLVGADAEDPAFKLNGELLSGDRYTASASSYARTVSGEGNEVSAKVSVDYYTGNSLSLRAVRRVTFATPSEFAAASPIPPTAYLFDGETLAEPEEPALDRYEFVGWTAGGALYSFAAEVSADLDLVASFTQLSFDFAFRAVLGEDYSSEKYLVWDEDERVFRVSSESAAATFVESRAIPKASAIPYFRIVRWLKVTLGSGAQPEYTEVAVFEASVSLETGAQNYYIAEMAFDVGLGDANGDGSVNVDDILLFKRAMTNFAFTRVSSAAEAWTLGETESPVFFLSSQDVNGDGFFDGRDVVTSLESLVGGYGYTVVRDKTADGSYVSGEQIAREDAAIEEGDLREVSSIQELISSVSLGRAVLLTEDLSAEESDLTIAFAGDITIDLGGHSLTAENLSVRSGGVLTLRNGDAQYTSVSLRADGGIYIKNLIGKADTDGSDQEIVS